MKKGQIRLYFIRYLVFLIVRFVVYSTSYTYPFSFYPINLKTAKNPLKKCV